MQEIKGLMATPTVRSAGGLRAAVPQLDMTAQKNANEALSNATKYFALRTRQEKQAEEDMLNARASSMLNEYNLYGKDVLYGKNGAMYQKGTEVVSGVDGESWVSYNQGKLREKRDAILSSVEGDKRLYDKVKAGLEKLDVTFYSTLDAHYGQESHNYVVDQATIGLNNELSAITAGGVTSDRVKAVKGYMADLARFAGRNVKDPTYAKAYNTEVRTKVSAAAKDGITLLLDRNDTSGADAKYLAAVSEGMLDANDQLAVQKQITDKKDALFVSDAASNVTAMSAQDRTPTFVAARAVAPQSGVLDSSLLSAAGLDAGKAVEDGYGKNKAVTESVNAQVMGALVREYGSAEAAIAAAVVGKDTLEAAVRSAAEKGNIAAWQTELSPENKGKVTSAVRRYRSDAMSRTVPDEAELRMRVVSLYPNATSDQVSKIVDEAKTRLVEETAMRSARQYAAANNVVSALSNGETPNASDMAVLSAEQAMAVSALKARQRAENPPSDMAFYMSIQNPQTLKGMSDADFLLLGQANLSPEEYAEASQRRNALKGVKNLDKLYVSRDTVKLMVESFMASMNPKYNEDDDGKYVFNRTVDLVRRKVQEVANARGKELTKAEIEEIVGQTLRGDRFFVPPGFAKSGEYKSIYSLEFGDLSGTAKDLAKEMAKSMYGDSYPDDASALSAFKEFLLFSTEDLPDNVIAKAKAKYSREIDVVREQFQAQGKYLTDTAAIRMTLYALQRDPKYFELLGNKADPKYNSATGVRKSVLYDEEFRGAD